VINYDVPATVEAYTHRTGRTGRAENNGEALTFASREEMKMVREIEKALAGRMRRENHELTPEELRADRQEPKGGMPASEDRRPGRGRGRASGPDNKRGGRGERRGSRTAGVASESGDKAGRPGNRRRRRGAAPLGVGYFTGKASRPRGKQNQA